MSLRSSWVSWSDTPREQSAPSGEDTVMEDCTESHQSEINWKITGDDKLRKIFVNMPEEHKVLTYGDSFSSNMQSLDVQKTIPNQSKARLKNRRIVWSESQRRSRRNSRNVWKSFKKSIEADQELEAANSKQTQAKHKMAILVAEQTAENAKTVHPGIPVVRSHTTGSTSDESAQQTILSGFKSVVLMQSMECHSVSWRLMAAGATDEDVKKISQTIAQTVRQLEAGNAPPEPGIEAHRLPCVVVVEDIEFSTG